MVRRRTRRNKAQQLVLCCAVSVALRDLRVANFWQLVSLATDTLSPCTPAPRPPSTPSTTSVLPWHASSADFGILPPLRHQLLPNACPYQLPACELLHPLANMPTNPVRWTSSCNISHWSITTLWWLGSVLPWLLGLPEKLEFSRVPSHCSGCCIGCNRSSRPLWLMLPRYPRHRAMPCHHETCEGLKFPELQCLKTDVTA